MRMYLYTIRRSVFFYVYCMHGNSQFIEMHRNFRSKSLFHVIGLGNLIKVENSSRRLSHIVYKFCVMYQVYALELVFVLLIYI